MSRPSPSSPSSPSAAPATGIPSLPGLGTTWYERGTRYWLRRVRTAVLLLPVLAFAVYIALVLYASFRGALPPAVRTVWDGAQVIGSCGAVVWGWVRQRRDHKKALLDPPSPGEFRARKRAETGRSVGLAMAGRFLWLIAAPVLPALVAWGVGWLAASLTVHEYPSEAGARRWLQEHACGP
ncbi:hypothetical protein [Streptomyces sp. NK08204]|uniref:hypothetical protein n=1 Tax=Streptomyces sp. NK08204 TaxID=2873260 RepID=UPI001CECCBF3|nr:hypothetical protein [Streptomyces sp. NK08204]